MPGPMQPFPKLNLIQLSRLVADLCLLSEGSEAWVREPAIRRTWHALFFTTIGVMLFNWVFFPFVPGQVIENVVFTFYFRLGMVTVSLWILFLILVLSYQYYRFLLLTGKDLRFRSIFLLFVTAVLIFSIHYKHLYFLEFSLFEYPDSPVVLGPALERLGILRSLIISVDFVVYSFCTSLSLDYPRITSASMIVSALNIIQVLYSYCVVALLVATFVQKSGTHHGGDQN